MIAIVIVLGVLVLVLAAWLFGTRRALRDARNRGDDLNERLVQLWDAVPTVAADPEGTSRRIWADHDFSVPLPLLDR